MARALNEREYRELLTDEKVAEMIKAGVFHKPPKLRKGLYFEIVRPKMGRDFDCIVLSESLLHTMTHYYNARTHLCTKQLGACQGCDGKSGERYYGFLAGYFPNTKQKFIIELTQNAVENCPELQDEEANLRGCHIRISRRGRGSNGKVYCEFLPRRYDPDGIPVEFDLHKAIVQILGTNYTKIAAKQETIEAGRNELPV